MVTTTITVISGFLGAGKTTLLKELLNERAFGISPILVENDYGALSIDSMLLRETGIVVEEVDSGCICCSVRGAFKAGVERVLEEYHPHQLIIEPSGVGKLSKILKQLDEVNVPKSMEIKRTLAITVVDASRFEFNDSYVSEYFWDQVKCSDVVVVNRTEGLGSGEKECIIGSLCEKTDYAPMLNGVSKGNLNYLKRYINSDSALIDRKVGKVPLPTESKCTCGHDHDGDCGHGHSHAEEGRGEGDGLKQHRGDGRKHAHDFQSWSSYLVGQFSEMRLESLDGILQDADTMGQVMRAKGIFPGEDQYYLFDYVPGQGTIQGIGEQESGWVMVIGRSLQKENLELLFAS